MSAFIGPLGGLLKFKCPSAEQVSYGQRSGYRDTLGGRVIEQRGPLPRRSWDVSIGSASPESVSALEAMYMAGGNAPLAFLPPDALSVNMLTPDVSLFSNGTFQAPAVAGGPMVASDGVIVPRTLAIPGSSTVVVGQPEGGLLWGVPVVAGEQYRVSAYGIGIGTVVSIAFRNLSGVTVGSGNSGAFTSTVLRRSFTATAPAGAVEMLIRFITATSAATVGAPAVTWGPTTSTWGVGRGARKASIESFSFDVSHAVAGDPSLNMSSYSMRVREIG